MPNLALSRTARTLNSWSPSQADDAITSPTVNPKDDLIIPNDASFDAFPSNNNARPAFRATSYDIKSSRRRQNRLLEVSRERFQYLDGSGRGPVTNANHQFDVESYGFASHPIPMSQLNGNNNEAVDGGTTLPKEEYIPSTNNRDVRFQVRGTPLKRGKRVVNHSVNVPIKYIWMEPSLGCSSPLILATNSSQPLSHLRKWNSQPCLIANKIESTKIAAATKEFPDAKTKSLLKRNASLPDLRQAKQLDATKLHKARPKTEISDTLLIRSPSDTGRSLTFWMSSKDDSTKPNGAVKSFTETTAVKRTSLENKLLVFRNHWFNQITAPIERITGKQDDWSKDENSSDLSDFSAKSLAEELTLLGRELLLAVEPVELVTYVMKPRMSSEESCPNLFRLLRFYERTTSLVATEILRSDNATKRAQIIALIIEAAEKCRLMQNWQSTKALLSGIQCPPVARLENTWTQLRQQYPDHNSTFESLATEDYGKDGDNETEKPRQLAAMPYFGDVLSKVRGRPTISRLRPARPLWKEPPSLAKWVEEQISIALTCDTCNSTVHKNRACCYLMVFVLGKNVFCPVRKMPDAFVQNALTSSPDYAEDNYNFRLDLAKVFDDPESLPFTSPHIQCSALQPQNTTEIRHRSEIYLRSAQATARAYDLECNQRARNYLLKRPYHSLLDSMKRSLQIEPSKNKKNS